MEEICTKLQEMGEICLKMHFLVLFLWMCFSKPKEILFFMDNFRTSNSSRSMIAHCQTNILKTLSLFVKMYAYYALLHSLEDLKFSEEAMRQFRIQFISLLFIYRPNTFKLNATKTRQKHSENQIFKRNKKHLIRYFSILTI